MHRVSHRLVPRLLRFERGGNGYTLQSGRCMWDDQSRVFSYEAVAKGHTTRGIIPNTVASLPVYIVDIVPNQCALTNEGLIASVCLDCVSAEAIISRVSPPQYQRMNQLLSCCSPLLAVLLSFQEFLFFSRQMCTSLWISYSSAPVAERCGSDKLSKVRRTHLKRVKP